MPEFGEMLQSLRCEMTFQAVLSVHQAVAAHFRFECPQGSACRVSDCPKWHHQRGGAPCKYGAACKRPREGPNACSSVKRNRSLQFPTAHVS